MCPGWTRKIWWARQDLNLGPTDYEFKEGRTRITCDGLLLSATTLILLGFMTGSNHR